MIEEWLIVGTAISVAILCVLILPPWLERRTASRRTVNQLADDFYASADKLASNKQTPLEILNVLAIINQRFGHPSVVRKIVWAALRGQLTEHAQKPTTRARAFLRAFNDMPKDLQQHFTNAMVCSLLASAERAGLYGFVFIRMMLFNPAAQKQSDAPTYASEIASTHDDLPIAA